MNPEKPANPDDETSRKSEESSSSENNPNVANFSNSSSTEVASKIVLTESECCEEHFENTREEGTPTNSAGETNQETIIDTTEKPPKNQVDNDSAGIGGETDEMKRAAAKKLIERYFYQLIDGCGSPNCKNKNCASSGEVEKMTPNQAAARAIQLFSQDAKLCDDQPVKLIKTKHIDQMGNNKSDNNSSSHVVIDCQEQGSKFNEPSSSSRTTSSEQNKNQNSSDTPSTSTSSSCSSSSTSSSSNSCRKALPQSSSSSQNATISYLDEDRLIEIIESNPEEHIWNLRKAIFKVFKSFDFLSNSFLRKPSTTMHEILEKAPTDLKSLKKEDLRTLEGEIDKDEDSSADKEEEVVPYATNVDLPSLRRTMEKVLTIFPDADETISLALNMLLLDMISRLMETEKKTEFEKAINIIVIIFEITTMCSSQLLDVLPRLCQVVSQLPTKVQARLAWIWSVHCKSSLRNLLQTLQQLITLQVITGIFTREHLVQDNDVITETTKVLKILYYANILAGELESSKLREEEPLDTSLSSIPEEESLFSYVSNKQPKPSCLEDQLALELDVNALDCRKPFLPFEDFYNEPLSDAIEMDNDYLYYKNITAENVREGKRFSFMLYSFILTPATKTLALYYDSRIRMYSERRMSIFQTHLVGQSPNPYLKLKVRRDQIIDDALVELEVIAMGNPKDLKKQLVVEFVGEQGIDEGGVSKEFFQLIVEQIFNPDYGMFIYQEDTKTVWFSSTSFENEAQFTLIGIVLGLAIYNNIILAVNFPMVVYRKLMGIKGSFYDLADWNPVLFNSLKSILDYEEPDFEEVFMLTFKISYNDVFGNVLEHELKSNGGNIYVTQDNKKEFVDLYTDFLLNSSIAKQFKAFRKGFQMVTDESPLHLLFRPEEIELLVCGSKKFDFVELEKSTEYEGGYTEKSKIICDFWSLVHALPLESKRKLLEFTTGSDRVPVGGLSKLKLVIARNGPDSDRLPTSHTCFNVLLLPEYETKEKLEDRLLKAINYSKGFGML